MHRWIGQVQCLAPPVHRVELIRRTALKAGRPVCSRDHPPPWRKQPLRFLSQVSQLSYRRIPWLKDGRGICPTAIHVQDIRPYSIILRDLVVPHHVRRQSSITVEDRYDVTVHTVKTRPQNIVVPSYLLIAVSSPLTTVTTTTFFTVGTNEEWAMLRYLGETARKMLMQLVGLTEAGAETPWEEAASLVGSLIERVVEETAGSFTPNTWTVFTQLTAEIDIDASMYNLSLSGGA